MLRLCVASLVLLLASCGGADPDAARLIEPRIVRSIEAADLFPADLDLVVRVDVERMTAAIGPAAAGALSRRAGLDDRREGGADEELFKNAMSLASVVWIGLRLADIDAGDRVVVVEGDLSKLGPGPTIFQPIESGLPGVSMVERAEPPRRAGTARIIRIGERAAAFVSPIEVDSIARVLRDGPDARRGDPVREGIVSLDLRPRRLPSALERRFPSIGAIIAGIKRIRAAVIPEGFGVRIDAEISARNAPAAERARGFLEALRDNVEDPKSKDLMRALSIEQVEDVIRVRWVLPAKALAGLVEEPASRP